jgi:hypothetical protein
MTRGEWQTASNVRVDALARFAFGFIRDQIASVAALSTLLRGSHRRSMRTGEEERW